MRGWSTASASASVGVAEEEGEEEETAPSEYLRMAPSLLEV